MVTKAGMIKPFPQTLEELKTMFRCVMSAGKKRLSEEQVDWLMQDRQRCDYFEAVMRRE